MGDALHRPGSVSVLETKVLSEQCRQAYNRSRPHGSLGYETPEEFAATRPKYYAAGGDEKRK